MQLIAVDRNPEAHRATTSFMQVCSSLAHGTVQGPMPASSHSLCCPVCVLESILLNMNIYTAY